MTAGNVPPRGNTHGRLIGICCAMLGLYKNTISLAFPSSCRFTPTCSEYAAAALRKYGLLRGSRKTIARIVRCAPWSAGGIDEP